MNDTQEAIVFRRLTDDGPRIPREGYGCPECGSAEFSRPQTFVQHCSSTASGEWDDRGYWEINDEDDYDSHDTAGHEWDGDFTCSDCGHFYDEDEADLSQYESEDADDDAACIAACVDDECAGECRATTQWPFLADRGIVRADALGALLEQRAPHGEGFTWSERRGMTVIGVEPQSRLHRVGGYSDHCTVESCVQCQGDMSTRYIEKTTLPFKQERYPMSTLDSVLIGTITVPVELHIPICYVCHSGA